MKNYRSVLAVATLVLVLDQATKAYIRATMDMHESIVVLDGLFHLTHVGNTGGAFGLFSGGASALRLPFFLAVSLVAVVVLLVFVRRVEPEQRLLKVALGAILGGALGNLIDRIVFGHVTDFLDLHWRGYHWPAFNVADSGITFGMVVLVLYSLFTHEAPAANSTS